jgi:hypothetical protein
MRQTAMTVTIEIPDEQLAALKAKAAAHGLTLQDWLQRVAAQESQREASHEPLKSGYGMLAKYGAAPSAQEIDENRRDMFGGFATSF